MFERYWDVKKANMSVFIDNEFLVPSVGEQSKVSCHLCIIPSLQILRLVTRNNNIFLLLCTMVQRLIIVPCLCTG